MKITSFLIRRPKIANLILFLIVFTGIVSAFGLRRQGDPTIDFDIMKIVTEYPGASPEDVEINVTDKIEDELMDVEDIDEMLSMSMENLSIVFVYVNPDSPDLPRVKRDVRTAVDRVSDLPPAVTDKPKVEEIRSTNMAVMEVAITGDIPERELRKYAKDLENDLKEAKGIGVIEKVGYRKREIQIEADLDILEQKYVSLGEIVNAIQSRNVKSTGGSLESYVTEKKIVTFSEYDDPMEVNDVIIRSAFTGESVRISDVATVKDDYEEHDIIPRAGGANCIALIVRSQATADVIDLSKDVKKILGRFKKGLPDGVDAKIMYDNSEYTTSLLSMVKLNGIIGFILVLLVMLCFLDWKSAFWTAFGIPIAICGSLIFFEPLGITINMITLSAMVLVLGMLVDDAIVISENVFRMKQMGMEPVAATIEGVRNVFWPVTASVMTTILAFLPMLFMSGLIGKFIVGIPLVVILMLGFSLLESTCFLPSHIAHTKPPKKANKRLRWMENLIVWYKGRLSWCLKNRVMVMGLYTLLFAVVIVASIIWLKFILFPNVDPDIFNIVIETTKGMSLEQTSEKIGEVEKVVEELVPKEALRSYLTRVGHHDTDVYGGTAGNYSNYALITVNLKPADARIARAETIIEKVDKRVKALSGYDKIYAKAGDSGPPVGKPVTVIYTSDNDDLRAQFEKVTMEFVSNIPGVYGAETDNIIGKDELRLILDYDLMARLGVTALDVAKTVRSAFEGEVVTSIRKEGEEIDFRVRLKHKEDYRAEGVLGLKVANKQGKLVSIGSFGRFVETSSPAVFRHYDGRRSVTVTASVDTDVTTSGEVSKIIFDKFEPEVRKHAGFKMELGGEEKKTQESMKSFYYALIVALVAIYCLLIILFDSFTQPLLIMSAIPFAIIGVFITFMIHGLPLGFIALIGILGLIGVVVNASIVMVSTLNEMGAKDERMDYSTIVEGAAIRFRPVILTTITTVAGLLPTAYGIGGDLPFIRPMVLALAWGLVFATVISLVFIPLIYSWHVKVNA
ncbi:MAG: efflux RND transporter permease subunit [Deltaproteobacteria bacterium]|nr:efflux RND transporter permease subunit [Deltaproteobacteria bacterium]